MQYGLYDLNHTQLVNEGKLTSRPVEDFLKELKASRGGARPGAGRKSPLKAKYPNEVKKSVTLRLYPTQLKKIERRVWQPSICRGHTMIVEPFLNLCI